MWQSVIFMQVCILFFFTHLLYGSNFIPTRKRCWHFPTRTFHKFRKEAMNQVNSSLPSCQTLAKEAGGPGAEL
jgi:hypothetical protein